MSETSSLTFTGERIVPQANNCEPNFASRMFQEHIVRYLFASQIIKGKSVIDVGCGVGYGSQRLGELGAEFVHAFDLSEDSIRHARVHYAHPSVHFAVDNAEEFSVDRQFDVAVCFELIEHVDHPEKVLANIKRALKPDGILIMSTPRALEKKRTHFHVREFGLAEYTDFVKTCFESVDVYVENNHFSSLVTKARALDISRIEYLKDQFSPEVADVFIVVATSAEKSLPEMDPALSIDSDAYVVMLERDVEILHKAEDDLREQIEYVRRESASALAYKDAEIDRLTREYNSLFARSEELSTRLWESEMQHSDPEVEHKKLRTSVEALSVRVADADARRMEAYEFARGASDLANGLQRELDRLKRDLNEVLDRPQAAQHPVIDHKHRGIVEAMERIFVGAEATRHIARDPIVDRVAHISLEFAQLRERAESAEQQLAVIHRTSSWRLTAPLRGVKRVLARAKRMLVRVLRRA